MTDLRSALADYITVRRSLGYKLTDAERILGQFVAYCEQSGTSVITTEAAVAWATLPAGAEAGYLGQRLSMVRRFAAWMQTIDPATEVPPADILPGRAHRAVPYIYTDDEIAAVMAATSSLRLPLERATYETIIGLLAVTGIRIGEAIRLRREDVSLDTGLVRVIGSKFNKSREVPLHPSAVEALGRYVECRDRLRPQPRDPNFFVGTAGTALCYAMVQKIYRRLCRQAGLGPRAGGCRPRLHDLRHTVACNILVDWYRDGLDVQARLPLLSTFLGHDKPENTYWYLTAVPELLGLAAGRLEDTFEEGL
jgi:integrase